MGRYSRKSKMNRNLIDDIMLALYIYYVVFFSFILRYHSFNKWKEVMIRSWFCHRFVIHTHIAPYCSQIMYTASENKKKKKKRLFWLLSCFFLKIVFFFSHIYFLYFRLFSSFKSYWSNEKCKIVWITILSFFLLFRMFYLFLILCIDACLHLGITYMAALRKKKYFFLVWLRKKVANILIWVFKSVLNRWELWNQQNI